MMVPPSAATIGRSAASTVTLALYRNCLRSVKRIPDIDHRIEYLKYVRDGFRGPKRNLSPESSQALAALDDAREQLDRMNYYHSIREQKQQEQQSQQQQQETSSLPSHDALSSSLSTTTTTSRSNNDDNTTSSSETTITTNTATPTKTTTNNTTANTIIHQWLEKALPDLSDDDRNHYTTCLINDGFDTLELLSKDLIPTEDLQHFMKKGHQRAIIRTYFSQQQQQAKNNNNFKDYDRDI